MVVIIVLIFLNKSKLENGYKSIKEIFSQKEEREAIPKTFTEVKQENKSSETEKPVEEKMEEKGKESEEQEYKRINVKIVDICSGKLDMVFTVSEGVRQCLNIMQPYFIILEKNSTHIQTSFYNVTGFYETYELNESKPIFFLFVEDLRNVEEPKKFYLWGESSFYFGDPETQIVWMSDESGILKISKIMAILPLYVKENISIENWSEIRVYMETSKEIYYLGSLWFSIKK